MRARASRWRASFSPGSVECRMLTGSAPRRTRELQGAAARSRARSPGVRRSRPARGAPAGVARPESRGRPPEGAVVTVRRHFQELAAREVRPRQHRGACNTASLAVQSESSAVRSSSPKRPDFARVEVVAQRREARTIAVLEVDREWSQGLCRGKSGDQAARVARRPVPVREVGVGQRRTRAVAWEALGQAVSARRSRNERRPGESCRLLEREHSQAPRGLNACSARALFGARSHDEELHSRISVTRRTISSSK